MEKLKKQKGEAYYKELCLRVMESKKPITFSELSKIIKRCDSSFSVNTSNYYTIATKLKKVLGTSLVMTKNGVSCSYLIDTNSESVIFSKIEDHFNKNKETVSGNTDQLKNKLEFLWKILQKSRSGEKIGYNKFRMMWTKCLKSKYLTKNKLASLDIPEESLHISYKISGSGNEKVIEFFNQTNTCLKVDEIYKKTFGISLDCKKVSTCDIVTEIKHEDYSPVDKDYVIFLSGCLIKDNNKFSTIDDILKLFRDSEYLGGNRSSRSDMENLLKSTNLFSINKSTGAVAFKDADSWKELKGIYSPKNVKISFNLLYDQQFDLIIRERLSKTNEIGIETINNRFGNLVKITMNNTYHSFRALVKVFYGIETDMFEIVSNEDMSKRLKKSIEYEKTFIDFALEGNNAPSFRNTRIYYLEKQYI